MPSMNHHIQFKYGLQASLDTMTRDPNTVYFTTDTQRIFVGDAEFTRPIQHGDALPEGFMPPESLFYHEVEKSLYFSKTGSSWQKCSNFYEHPKFKETVVGQQQGQFLRMSKPFYIPEIHVNEEGHVTEAKNIEFLLPDTTVKDTEEGNAITGVEFGASGGGWPIVTVKRGTAFATKTELAEAVGKITSFEIDAGLTHNGYDTLEALQEAHPVGEKGVIYLVKPEKTSETNQLSEFLWITDKYEQIGTFGDVDLSAYATSADMNKKLNEKVDKTITVNDQPLSENVIISEVEVANTGRRLAEGITIEHRKATEDPEAPAQVVMQEFNAGDHIQIQTNPNQVVINVVDSEYPPIEIPLPKVTSSESADKLSTGRKITLAGHATGEATFDGTGDITINTTINNAIADEDGNNIKATYASKTELADAVKWETF